MGKISQKWVLFVLAKHGLKEKSGEEQTVEREGKRKIEKKRKRKRRRREEKKKGILWFCMEF